MCHCDPVIGLPAFLIKFVAVFAEIGLNAALYELLKITIIFAN